MGTSSRILCPSYRCQDGAILLGIVQADGKVALAGDRIVIDQTFVEVAQRGRPPGKRFRFAGACEQAHCQQWAAGRCGVIDKVLVDLGEGAPGEPLPECSIRPECRWYLQSGEVACRACPEVITDMTVAEEGAGRRPVEYVPLGTDRLTPTAR